jgi:hypothetical protein
MLAPFRWVEREVYGDPDESLARLRLVPVTMVPAGVVPLLGGIAEVCRHFSRYFAGLVDVSGRELRSGVGSAR